MADRKTSKNILHNSPAPQVVYRKYIKMRRMDMISAMMKLMSSEARQVKQVEAGLRGREVGSDALPFPNEREGGGEGRGGRKSEAG